MGWLGGILGNITGSIVGGPVGTAYGSSIGGSINASDESKIGNILSAGIFGGDDEFSPLAQYMGKSNLADYGANPYSQGLSDAVSKMPEYSPISAQPYQYQGGSYTAKDMSKEALPQYDAIRSRINTQFNGQQQQGQEALDRQFAAMGGGPGNGAQLKQTENLATGIAQAKGNALLGLDAEEANARSALTQREKDKEFQSGEASRGYGFQAGLEGSRQGMQAGMFNKQMQMNQDQFKVGTMKDIAGLNTAWDQAMAESNNNEFNKILAIRQSKHSGGLLGGGGFLGTGIGA